MNGIHFSDAYSDEELCEMAAAAGDRSAEEILARRYHRLVRACARPFFLAGGDSEDLIQEGMVGLLTAIREFSAERQTSFQTYAGVCIRNRIISAVKAASRDKHAPLNTYISFEAPLFDGKADLVSFCTSQQQGNPEDVLIDQESVTELQSALKDRLSDLESRILGLYLSGSSYLEIAQEVKRPPKSVDNAVQRIRRKVAQHIQSGDFSKS